MKILSLLYSLFGLCAHRRLTFPQTPIRRSQFGQVAIGATYRVCLDCGREFAAELGSGKLGAEIRRGESGKFAVLAETK